MMEGSKDEDATQVTLTIRFALCSKHESEWDDHEAMSKPMEPIRIIREVRNCSLCEPFDFEEGFAYRPD